MHLPKISHLNAIYFKLFAIWFVLVHVALRFMLWFCWYLNWKKHRKVHGFCLFLSIYLYFVWNAYFHLCQSVQSARILYGWDPEIPLIEQNEAHNFCRSVFFLCVQSKQCGNGKTNIIANLHRQWCSHSVSALSHQLPGTFLQTKYSSSNAPSVDRWFFSISIQPNVKWYSLPPVCLLLITIVMLLIF